MKQNLGITLFLKNARSRLDKLRRPSGDGINRFEHRVYSQHREDGIIEHVIRVAGIADNRCVEFGFGPSECNCLNLVLKQGFTGLFIDSNNEKSSVLSSYFTRTESRSRVLNRFLDIENINHAIGGKDFSGEIAVLSIDVDGNDYWLWDAIEVCKAKLVVIEYNASFGSDRSVSVPYDPNFVRYEKHQTGFYHGASLMALVRLGDRKGYSLIGCDSSGVNAFFLSNDLVSESLPRVTIEKAFRHHRSRTKYKGVSPEHQWEVISDMPYHEVGIEYST
jgi:hypothetical protein